MAFDPNNSALQHSGLFALPFTVDDAAIVIVPAPWGASSSQGWKSSTAPDSVYEASKYVELFDPTHGAFYKRGNCHGFDRRRDPRVERVRDRAAGAPGF